MHAARCEPPAFEYVSWPSLSLSIFTALVPSAGMLALKCPGSKSRISPESYFSLIMCDSLANPVTRVKLFEKERQ
jgi:hypothetical protein